MSALALVTRELGAAVSGSDKADSPYCARLRNAGIEPAIGHNEANLPAGAEVVVSTAIPADNPELGAARERAGARVIHRGELLAEVARLKRSLAVAGTHGKTTTAGMVAHALAGVRRGPGLPDRGRAARGGHQRRAGGRGSGSSSRPTSPTARSSTRARRRGRSRTSSSTTTPRSLRFASSSRPSRTSPPARARRGRWRDGRRPGPSRIAGAGDAGDRAGSPPGCRARPLGARASRSTAWVSSCACRARTTCSTPSPRSAPCRAAGLEPADAAAGARVFEGAGRRFEQVGATAPGARVFDDYAHHPTEVRATLEAARDARGRAGRRLLPAPPLLAHAGARPRLRRARSPSPTSPSCSTSTRPASAPSDFPGVSGLARGAARRPTPRAGGPCGGCRRWTRPRPTSARSWAPATCS